MHQGSVPPPLLLFPPPNMGYWRGWEGQGTGKELRDRDKEKRSTVSIRPPLQAFVKGPLLCKMLQFSLFSHRYLAKQKSSMFPVACTHCILTNQI